MCVAAANGLCTVANNKAQHMPFCFDFTCSFGCVPFTAHRKHKRLAPVCHAVVCEDCTLLPSPSRRSSTSPEPVFCVELKPKQGFLSGGHEHCPFCLNQFLKVMERVLVCLYCALFDVSSFGFAEEAREDSTAEPVLPSRSVLRVRSLTLRVPISLTRR